MGAVTAIAAAAVIGAGSAYYANEQREEAAEKSQERQEEANQAQEARASVDRARSRRKAIAKARVAQAQNEAMQSSQVDTSSTLSGVQSGITSGLAGNLSAQRGQAKTQQFTFDRRQEAQNIMQEGQRNAALTQSLGNTFSSGLNSYAGMQG